MKGIQKRAFSQLRECVASVRILCYISMILAGILTPCTSFSQSEKEVDLTDSLVCMSAWRSDSLGCLGLRKKYLQFAPLYDMKIDSLRHVRRAVRADLSQVITIDEVIHLLGDPNEYSAPGASGQSHYTYYISSYCEEINDSIELALNQTLVYTVDEKSRRVLSDVMWMYD
ncbi:MAG: hypothetical protein AB7H80_15245 [Candidatus Kapaibacterium sp.]